MAPDRRSAAAETHPLGRQHADTVIDSPLSEGRDVSVHYHIAEGTRWLEGARERVSTTRLAYAAFEYRLAIERIVFEYFYRLKGSEFSAEDWRAVSTYARLERRIYDLAGHQRDIDRHIAFFSTVLDAMKVPLTLARPNFGRLKRAWHDCSELCHLPWTLASQAPDAFTAALSEIAEVGEYLVELMKDTIAWPAMGQDATYFADLRRRFLAGEAMEDDVRASLAQTGVWGRLVVKDGTASFVGETIPPATA